MISSQAQTVMNMQQQPVQQQVPLQMLPQQQLPMQQQFAIQQSAPPNQMLAGQRPVSGVCCGCTHQVSYFMTHVVLSSLILVLSCLILILEVISVSLECRYVGAFPGFWVSIICLVGASFSISAAKCNNVWMNITACVLNSISCIIGFVMCLMAGIFSNVYSTAISYIDRYSYDRIVTTICFRQLHQINGAIGGICFFLGALNLANSIISCIEFCKCSTGCCRTPARAIAQPIVVSVPQFAQQPLQQQPLQQQPLQQQQQQQLHSGQQIIQIPSQTAYEVSRVDNVQSNSQEQQQPLMQPISQQVVADAPPTYKS